MSQATVIIEGYEFKPPTVEIQQGESVTWANKDDVTHDATADDKSWTTGPIPPGESRSVKFPQQGTFPYHCGHHPDIMKGTVVAIGF